MRVLLWNTKTRLYYQDQDCWTADTESAREFGASVRAALFAQENSLQDVEVYLDFGNEDWNVYLPIGTRSSPTAG